MLLSIAIVGFFIMVIASYLLFGDYVTDKETIALRLKALDNRNKAGIVIDEEMAVSFKNRIVTPLFDNISHKVAGFLPSSLTTMVEEKLLRANGLYGLSAEQFLGLCGVLGLLVAVLVADFLVLSTQPTIKIIGWSLVGIFFGLVTPFLMLNHKIITREAALQNELPDVLDLLTVSVEAGLGFDGALVKLSEKMKGEMVDEFTRMLQEIRIGVPRRNALRSLAARCNIQDVSLFTSSLIQADQLGVSIAKVLRIQSTDMRERRRQRAEEKAMKAPIKMLFPLVFFIFPALFIVLLGPAALKVIQIFSNK